MRTQLQSEIHNKARIPHNHDGKRKQICFKGRLTNRPQKTHSCFYEKEISCLGNMTCNVSTLEEFVGPSGYVTGGLQENMFCVYKRGISVWERDRSMHFCPITFLLRCHNGKRKKHPERLSFGIHFELKSSEA